MLHSTTDIYSLLYDLLPNHSFVVRSQDVHCPGWSGEWGPEQAHFHDWLRHKCVWLVRLQSHSLWLHRRGWSGGVSVEACLCACVFVYCTYVHLWVCLCLLYVPLYASVCLWMHLLYVPLYASVCLWVCLCLLYMGLYASVCLWVCLLCVPCMRLCAYCVHNWVMSVGVSTNVWL